MPDQLITLTNPMTAASPFGPPAGFRRGRTGPSASEGTTPVPPLPGACAAPGHVQLGPQALEAIHAASQDPSEPTARSLGITGAGVKVAFISTPWTLTTRTSSGPDGQHVIVNDEDFSGEGLSAPTGGEEAFLDAGSIAAQGNEVYDVSHYSPLPLNRPCDIRIEGVAPGASLVALDFSGSEDAGFASSFIQAINYAVTVDHVNVINESLGGNYYPDDCADLDVIKAANDAAVAAGTTVVVGELATPASPARSARPATDPNVISAGATTTYRIDAQDGYGGARFPDVRGWLDNNISSFSSSGFTQDGSTVSLVAPGELNWALCSTDTAQYSDCSEPRRPARSGAADGGNQRVGPSYRRRGGACHPGLRADPRRHRPDPGRHQADNYEHGRRHWRTRRPAGRWPRSTRTKQYWPLSPTGRRQQRVRQAVPRTCGASGHAANEHRPDQRGRRLRAPPSSSPKRLRTTAGPPQDVNVSTRALTTTSRSRLRSSS